MCKERYCPEDRHLIMWSVKDALPESINEQLGVLKESDAPPKAYLVPFLHLVGQLKSQRRSGWVAEGVPHPESIADHMYRMAVISMLTEDEKLDVARCVQISVCHDLAECLVGDITPADGVPKEEKSRRERLAMKFLRDLVAKFNPRAGDMLYELWCDYEYQRTPEAQFVKDVDKFELLVQVGEYQSAHPSLDLAEFQSVRRVLKTDEVKEWAKHV